MGALNKFLGKPKEVVIDGEKIQIHPLRVKDMHLFSKDAKDNPEEMKKINKQIMKLSVPEATEEEIDNLPMRINVKLMEEINKLNGFTNEQVESIKKRIKQE